ncbi:hypothetical protein KY285_036994 [Solanum tuberosum]|nr:hypothetical protein KY285_036994 [Solanum tuberosum]
MFVVKINGTELRFGIKEFAAITGLKCGLLTDFFSNPYIPNRIILKYFGDMTKVPKLDFFNKFKHANFFETEDRFKIGILYFITSFLTGSEASKTTIPKLYFDLVESGQYVNFPWGNECFRLTLKACSLAIRVSNVTPRILNWKTSNESIFFDDLKNTIFRTHGNQHKFRNIVLTEEELNAMDQINLHQSSSQHETENQATLERHDADFDEKYVELKKEIAEVDKHMTDMKAYVDNSTKLIIEEIRSSRGQPSQATHQQDDARQHVEESEKAPMDQPSVSMREYVHTSNTDDEAQKSNDQTIGVVFNADIPGSSNSKPPTLDDYPDFTMTQIVALDPILNANTTPDVQPRNRNPGKYDTSPYIRLSEGESSSRRVPILFRIKHPFESHNGFEVATELIDEFNKWVFKDVSSRRGRKSAYSKLKDSFEPQMDFGVVKVAEKDFFNIMVKPGRPWEDGHVNTIMYYLRRKAKYSPIPLSYSTVDCWFMTWVDNIEKQWRESNCDMRSISPDHDVGQCIRGFKLLANIPWDNVDNVIIPVNISEKFHWFLVVFRIKLRCLHVYDSMKGGAVHTKKVNEAVGKHATMIPLFLTSTGFYGKRLDLYANKLPKYVHKS